MSLRLSLQAIGTWSSSPPRFLIKCGLLNTLMSTLSITHRQLTMGKRSQIHSQSKLHQPEPTTTPVDSSQNPSSSSKITFRPRKIRKLTSNNNKKPEPDYPNPSQPVTVLPIDVNPLTLEGEIDLALSHLRSSDPLLTALIDSYKPPAFESQSSPPFLALAKSILYQQLATNAANAIYNRFVSLCGGESEVVPDNVLALNANQLRKIGVSGRKASYLHDLANKYREGVLSDSSIVEMDDESLLTKLTLVKGIGVWSVHMFMIFSLYKPDVLPVGDLGVRKGVQLLYGLKELPKPLQMEELCDKWKPYRSVGAWYVWRFMEAKGVLTSTEAPASSS